MNKNPMALARGGVGLTAALALVAAPFVAAPALADDAEPAPPHVAEVKWTGEAGGDLGYGSSRWSCDVNGDEIADTIVGDWWWKKPGVNNAGAAYVLLGSEDPKGGPIGAGSEGGAVRIDGPSVPNAFAGMSVSCLGDINGDELDDVIVGSNRTQRTWVILGDEEFEPVDVDALGSRGFEVTSSAAVADNAAPGGSSNFGYWVSGLGDVNGDGLDDFAVTDNLWDRPANAEAGTAAVANAGRVWVLAGSQDVGTVDVDSEAGAQRVLFTIDGAGGQIISAENVDDINGDGLADLVLGSYAATPWGSVAPVAGAAYAVFGSSESTSVDLANLGDRGFAIYGSDRGRDRLGTSVAKVGDVNGDGLADFVVGGDGVSNAATGARNGGAALVLGSASPQTVFTEPAQAEGAVYSCDDDTVNTTGVCVGDQQPRGYWIDGAADGDKLGWSAAGVDDINGDGVPETVLGAWAHDSAGNNAGALYVVYGNADFNGTISTADLATADGFRIDGAGAGAQLGRSAGGITDFDGNGVPDVVGGANGTDYASVFLLGPATTSATLTAGELSVGAGGTLTAEISARTGAGDVTGTVAFSMGGDALEGCEAVAVDQGVATCELDELPVGSEQLFTASFTDPSGAFAEASAEERFTVLKRVDGAGKLSLDGRVVEYGDTVTAEFTSKQALNGEVEFLSGDEVLATANAHDGEAEVELPQLDAGKYSISARYLGDSAFEAFDVKGLSLRITKGEAVEIDAPKLSKTSVVYGAGAVTATVTVPNATSGTVTFTDNGRTLGKVNVAANGRASVTLRKPVAGSHAIAAKVDGSTNQAASAVSDEAMLKVSKAKPSSVKASAKKFTKGTKPKVTVKVGKLNNGSYATGKVTVKVGSHQKTVNLKASQKGKVTVTLGKKFTKSISAKASFKPKDTKNVASAKAKTIKVKVKK